ncbi:MAG: LbtU family siderophore porin [Halothiobacillaceae bacterium]|nr:LbtU family siderophore porin [Halothiobacillaceae bacterium]
MNRFAQPTLLAAAVSLGLASQAATADNQAESYPAIDFGGVVEVEAYQSSPYTGSDESDIVLATGALSLEAAINEWVRAEISTLYEENDTPLEVDTASVMLGAEDSLWSLRAGQFYVPFGVYETAMVSDPLTLELGETRETAISAGVGQGGLAAEVYAFNGDLEDENQIDNFGATAGYAGTVGAADLALSAGYLNSLGESDGIEETVYGNTGGSDIDEVGAWTTSALLGLGDVTLVGEYLAAIDSFDAGELAFNGGGAQPTAWNLEASYGFDLMGKPASAAIGYQGTEESIALGLPQRRVLAALSVEIFPSTALSFEYAHDEDYDVADGGTGESAGTFLTQLAVAF